LIFLAEEPLVPKRKKATSASAAVFAQKLLSPSLQTVENLDR